MRRFHAIESLKIFIFSQPPAIVFLLCLFSFIIVLSSFTGYINNHNVDNPDEIDWNIFRDRLASLEYCFKYPADNNKLENNVKNYAQNIETYKYDLTFDVNYLGNLTALHNLDILSGSIDGFLIGLEKGKLDVKFQIDGIKYSDIDCKDKIAKDCSNFIIDGCVTLESSMPIFPKTKAPKTCSNRKYNKKNKNIPSRSHSSTLTAYKETPELTTQYWCPSSFGAKSIIKNKNDPSLNALLTKIDKIIICRNLEFIIVALSLICTIIIVAGIVKAARKKSLYYTQVFDM